jgi:hypothetical protein
VPRENALAARYFRSIDRGLSITATRSTFFGEFGSTYLFCWQEAAAVGRADGAELAANEPVQMLATLLTYPPDAGTSMYFDRVAGRPFETEALTGAVEAAGDRHRIPIPLNRLLLPLLRATNNSAIAIKS